jgi:hypothetical protein
MFLGLRFFPFFFLLLGWWSPLLFLVTMIDYMKNNVSTDMVKGRGNKRAIVTRGSRNPKHGKRKHYIVHKPSRSN